MVFGFGKKTHREVTAQELEAMLRSGDALVVDVREAHLQGLARPGAGVPHQLDDRAQRRAQVRQHVLDVAPGDRAHRGRLAHVLRAAPQRRHGEQGGQEVLRCLHGGGLQDVGEIEKKGRERSMTAADMQKPCHCANSVNRCAARPTTTDAAPMQRAMHRDSARRGGTRFPGGMAWALA